MPLSCLNTGLAARIDGMLGAIAACAVIAISPAGAEILSEARSEPLVQERAARHLAVPRGHAEILRYSREPGIVILGDPTVAVASIAASDILVLTALRPGETNVIVLADDGAQIDRMFLRVTERGDTVIVRRGIERETLRCNPLCSPIDHPGFAPSEFTPFADTEPSATDGDVETDGSEGADILS